MKIKLEVPYSHFVIIDVDQDSGVLLRALSSAKLVTSEGYGKDIKWIAAEVDKRLSFEVVQDDFLIAPHDAITKLTSENALTTTRWLAEYSEKNKIQAELTELKNKIESLGIEIK
jgi:hypothetical protein